MKKSKVLDLYLYYILVGVLSFIALVFLPFFGSEVGMGFSFPTTPAGWIVYIVQQALMSLVNILIFHSFVCQAFVNVRDNPNYQKAKAIFNSFTDTEYIPLTLKQFNRKEYGKKGVAIFLGTLLGGFALTQAILAYDYIRMLAYLFTIIFGVIFGVYEMKKYEEYLTDEYLQSALYQQKVKAEEEMAKERHDEEKIDSIPETVCESEVPIMFPDTVADN